MPKGRLGGMSTPTDYCIAALHCNDEIALCNGDKGTAKMIYL
jgi:hypothetical protein